MQDLFHKNRPIVGKTLPVLLPLGLDKAYDYLVPEHLEVALGDFVRVPLGNHERMGVVWEHPEGREGPDVEPEKLKSIIDRYDVPPLPRDSIKFAQWVADYNLMPLGTVVRMMMSASRAFEPEKPVFGVRLAGARPPRMTAARQRVLDLVENGLIWSKADLSRQAGVSAGVIDGLVKAGTLVSVEMPRKKPVIPRADYARTELTEAQEEAAYRLKSVVEAQNFTVTLIDGVTGSGKTEVYFEAVAEALRQDKQTLLLLPEIALTSQFLSRFEKRFGCRPVEWHSQLSQLERGRIWRAVAAGEARAVIGARSALYLPFCELGLIVVDEEHDTSFKQEDRGTYHGRDMAVVRALLADVPIVLASATPSLESLVNAQSGKYRYIQLSERYSDSETARSRNHRPQETSAGKRNLAEPGSRRCGQGNPCQQQSGAAVSQSPRLCASDLVPQLRLPVRLSSMRRLVGGAPVSPSPAMSSLRIRDTATETMSALPGAGFPCGLRSRSGARCRRG